MHLEEERAVASRREKKARPLLREDVVGPHGVPGFRREFIEIVARCDEIAEGQLGEQRDLVIVVEHHAPRARDAEVLAEQVPGEDARRGQLADRAAILQDPVARARVIGTAQIQVERRHAGLDVQVLHDQPLPVPLDHRGARRLEFREERRIEPRERERHVRELERVGHPAHAIMVLDELVLATHVVVRRLLRRPEGVAHELEHTGERRQREDDHHQSAHTGGLHEPVCRVRQVFLQVAIEEGLALLLQPDRRVELRRGARRHELPQESDVRRRYVHLHHEVATRETEEHVESLGAEEQRVEDQRAVIRRVPNGYGERMLLVAVDDPPDDVRGLAAEEERGEHLHLKVRVPFLRAREMHSQGPDEMPQVAWQVLERHTEPGVRDDRSERATESLRRRVVTAIRRTLPVDELRRDRRAPEDVLIAVVGPLEDAARDRVEERLGQLGPTMIVQEFDVGALDLRPDRFVVACTREPRRDGRDGLPHPRVVQVDARALRRPHRGPVCALEPLMGLGAHLAEDAVVPIEALEDRPGDVAGQFHLLS